MASLHDPQLEQIFKLDKIRLETTSLPIVTVSGTFGEDLKKWYGEANVNTSHDVVFSRAHFSMAYAALLTGWDGPMNPKKAWLVDPTNFVSIDRWNKVSSTEKIGKLIARVPFLKFAKDFVDKFVRSKLPILDSITPPLLYLFENVHQPILCFHIAAGNILAKLGKEVVQVITDPHVREDYLTHANLPNMHYCVFDDDTKFELLEHAFMAGYNLDPTRVVVTGPPIDQRIIDARNGKNYDKTKPLKILITTGGLGTNKSEIKVLLEKLLPTLHHKEQKYELMLYAGTQNDFMQMGKDMAKEHRVKVNMIENLNDTPYTLTPSQPSHLSLIYHPQIFDANELLIKHGIPFANCVICKPSGDMAYDAVAAGAFLLLLKPWGVWEERIEDIFWQKGIARKAEPEKILKQLEALTEIGWIESAQKEVKNIEPLHLHGIEKILEAVKTNN